MALPWLTALKVIPWGDVIEHAPKVLKAARELVDRQRERRRGESEPPPPGLQDRVIEMPGPTDPAVSALQRQLAATREELARLQHTQEQTSQTVAELAEQNSRLVEAVALLRLRTRWLMGAVLALLLAGLVSWLTG